VNTSCGITGRNCAGDATAGVNLDYLMKSVNISMDEKEGMEVPVALF
jgi:hypothetical protein